MAQRYTKFERNLIHTMSDQGAGLEAIQQALEKEGFHRTMGAIRMEVWNYMADQHQSRPDDATSSPIAVECVETGKRYNSCREAARDHGINKPDGVLRSMWFGTRYRGHHFIALQQ